MISPLRISASTLARNYVTLSLFVLALIALPIWYAWREVIDLGRTQILVADMHRLIRIYHERGMDALIPAIDSRLEEQPENDEKYYLLTNAALEPIVGNLPIWPAELSSVDTSPEPQTLKINENGVVIRAVLVRSSLPGGYHLLVGRNTAYHQNLERLFVFGVLGAAALILLLGAFIGALIRRALLSEVNRISVTTSAIVEGDLSRRLPTRGGADELNMLAETVNRMLDQIEQLIQGVRNVSNSIAHDLRTPLAELRFALEDLAVTRPSPERTFAELETAVADIDRVMAIFNALLRLAEIETGARRSGFALVDLDKVAAEAVEFYQPVAELKSVSLDYAGQAAGKLLAPGDPLLLAQAVNNLIDNALKYVPENGRITVQVARDAQQAIRITVADDGPGIPDAEKARVVERFYRSDTSRGTPGVGLGLSLVAAVAKLHAGTLELADNHPGLRATLVVAAAAASFPAAANAAASSGPG